MKWAREREIFAAGVSPQMRILWISHNLPYPPKTGVLQRSYNLLREVSRRHEVHLLAFLQESVLPGPYDLDLAERELGKLCAQVEVLRLPIEAAPAARYRIALWSLLAGSPYTVDSVRSAEMAQRIQEHTREVRYEIAHFDTIGLAAYRRDAQTPAKVLNHHNIESQLLRRRVAFEKNPLKRLYDRIEAGKLERYERQVCREFDLNLTVSQLDGERLMRICPDSRFEVVANGVDVDYFEPQQEAAEPGSVVMVGGMNWFPNRDAALFFCDRIWPALAEEFGSEVTCAVVGASPPGRLLALAAADERVTAPGFVDDVRPYLARAEVYVCPMRDGGGTRLKILDALAMGKAIVATPMACEGIGVTPERNVLLAESPSEFVHQIKRLRSDVDLRGRLGREAREFAVAHCSWDRIGRALNSAYAGLAETASGATP